MSWFNYWGMIIVIIIMIPNIVFAFKRKDGFQNAYHNKAVEILEQIGRYLCLALMTFNIPYTYFNFWFGSALTVYLTLNGLLLLAYLIFWIVFWKGNGKLRALALSVTPSLIFLFSGIILANIPLIAFAILFGVNHIFLSCNNADHKGEPSGDQNG